MTAIDTIFCPYIFMRSGCYACFGPCILSTTMAEQLSAAPPLTEGGSSDPVPTRSLLKRRVSSPSFETLSRKRIKDDNTLADDAANHFNSVSFESFLDELSEQLYCGCCSDLVYKPVLVMPCQHFFCGRWVLPSFILVALPIFSFFFSSCCIHWIRVSL